MKRFRLCRRAIPVLLLLAIVLPARADNDVITDFPGADVNIGERLFLETRFSQYFFTNALGDANAVVPGDPIMATLQTTNGSVPGPFAGQAMNCRQCHIVDEVGYGPFGNHTLGNRTYADFARRSPIPARDDGQTITPRNSPTLVDAVLPRDTPLFLHHDGQFASAHDLIIATLTGRNYGWKPEEYATAVHHIATIIRDDDGMGYLAVDARDSRFRVLETFLGSYQNVFAGFNNYLGSYIFDPRGLTANLISPQYRLDMRYASDDEILETIASLIETYLKNLTFSQATNGVDFVGVGTPIFNGSPFDVFLIKNNLPQRPATNETFAQYSGRLLQMVTALPNPQFVTDPADGLFETHTQKFQFGQVELAGLKIFLTGKDSPRGNGQANVGNCVTCHSLPAFTDFIFHNTGATQAEYDTIHGLGSFNQVDVPGLAARQANHNAYLPPTPNHPYATGIFETVPTQAQPGQVDLGLWNVYENPDFPAPQPGLRQILPRLMGVTPPQIENAEMLSQQFVFSGAKGPPDGIYYILASENALLPTTNWTIIATNTFDPQGHFNFSTPVAPGTAQTFYKLSLQMPTPAKALPRTIALFKTPTLRDLAHSGPYLHTGRLDSFEDVIRFYQDFSVKARLGEVRNADPELREIFLDDGAILPLAAFLRSLNEDYTD
ncbi:MAG: hypothetical protein JWR69_767 [Pedosphaera sp.]|nr:hypothetical protein [Pedosphaera sp.]